MGRGEAERLPAELAVQAWRGLRALALRRLRAAARAQRLATLLDFRPEVGAEILGDVGS